jgi:hypothetical protein
MSTAVVGWAHCAGLYCVTCLSPVIHLHRNKKNGVCGSHLLRVSHPLSELRSMIRDQRKFHNKADCMGQRISARIDRKIWLAGRSDPTKSEQSRGVTP